MSDILSQDEINALLSSMEEGGDLGIEEESSPEPIVSTSSPQLPPSKHNSGFSLKGLRDENLRNIYDIKIELIVIFGSKRLNISSIIGLKAGSVFELDKLRNEPVDILVNGAFIAVGELIVVDGFYGVRLSNLVSPEVRIKSLKTQ